MNWEDRLADIDFCVAEIEKAFKNNDKAHALYWVEELDQTASVLRDIIDRKL